MISLQVNGDPRESTAATVTEFAAELGLPPELLLIEHNGVALTRSEWPETRLKDGDRLEILRVAAGG